MKPMNFWNVKEHCINEASKYSTITELKINCYGCYSSLLKHNWERDCFPNFVKRKPNGYWDNKDLCFQEAKKYRNLSEFGKKCYGAYKKSKENGWINEIASLYDKTILYHSLEEQIHSVYVYEFKDDKVFYVGRTNNLKRRHSQHLKDKNDNLNKYCIANHINMPNAIILKSGLNAQESQYYEDFYLKEYTQKGWVSLNVAKTGVNVGSLGATCKWTYEKCSKEARKYKKIIDFELGSQSAYNACKKNGWVYDFFVSSKKADKYWDNYENCKKAFESCSSARELIKKYGGCYNAIKKNNFNDLKYKQSKYKKATTTTTI